jgi:hypothetical protein
LNPPEVATLFKVNVPSKVEVGIAAFVGIANALLSTGAVGFCVVVRSEYVRSDLVTWPVPVNGSPATGVAPGTPTDVAANAEGIT